MFYNVYCQVSSFPADCSTLLTSNTNFPGSSVTPATSPAWRPHTRQDSVQHSPPPVSCRPPTRHCSWSAPVDAAHTSRVLHAHLEDCSPHTAEATGTGDYSVSPGVLSPVHGRAAAVRWQGGECGVFPRQRPSTNYMVF